MMQGITLCYTQYFNRTYKRTGRLLESRYHSCVVDKGRRKLAVKVVDIFGNDTMTIVEVTVGGKK